VAVPWHQWQYLWILRRNPRRLDWQCRGCPGTWQWQQVGGYCHVLLAV